MSYQAEIATGSEFATNALRFATEQEAERYGRDLMSRWMMATDYRVALSDDPVNYRIDDDNTLVMVKEPVEA